MWRTLLLPISKAADTPLPIPSPTLPLPLKKLIAASAVPSVSRHQAFIATIASPSHNDFIVAVLPHLTTLTSASLRAATCDACDDALMHAMHAACTLPDLDTLHLSLPNLGKPFQPHNLQQLAAHLSTAPHLNSLAIHATFPAADGAAAELAHALCQLQSLSHLELTGACARPIAASLSSQISSLTALQGMHIDDKDVSDPSVVHLIRAAASLPRLTQLQLDATGHLELPREKFCTGGRTRQIVTAVACATLLQTLSFRSPVQEGRTLHAWCGLGSALGEQGARFGRLTQLELIGCVSCGQLPGVAEFVRGMTMLRALAVETGENYCGGDLGDGAVSKFAGALAGLTQLTAVTLAGPDVPAVNAMDFLTGLGSRPGLKHLGLVAGDMGTARDAARMVASNCPGLHELTVESDRAVQELHGCRGCAGFIGSMRKLQHLRCLGVVMRGTTGVREFQELAIGLRELSRLQELQLSARLAGAEDLEGLLELAPEGAGGGGDQSEFHRPDGPGLLELQILDMSHVHCGPGGGVEPSRPDLAELAQGEEGAGLLRFPKLQEVVLENDIVPREELMP